MSVAKLPGEISRGSFEALNAKHFPCVFSSMNRLASRKRQLLREHIEQLLACRRCPAMQRPVVSGGAILSKVLLIGQAPGDKEPILGRPFAWTAGKTLFGWFAESVGLSEDQF